jgi:hypothetical protein
MTITITMEPHAVGIVLLDEIEKAHRDVIQVLEWCEWNNKRLPVGSCDSERAELLEYASRPAYGSQEHPVTITTRRYSIVRLVQCKPE